MTRINYIDEIKLLKQKISTQQKAIKAARELARLAISTKADVIGVRYPYLVRCAEEFIDEYGAMLNDGKK